MTRSVAVGALVFVTALARSLADGFGLVDESWFLQVIARMRHGDVLYRDVFLGTTPLSAYVTLGVSLVTGVEIVAVKIVTCACFAVSAVLATTLVRRAGAGPLAWAVLAATFIWGRPYGNPPYTPMAMMLFLAAAANTPGVFLSGQKDAGGVWAWTTAGALAGLSFAAKQNVGLLAFAAVGAAWIATPGARTFRGGAALVGGFAVAAGLVLVPVVWSGGLPHLWDYGFAGKGGYVALGAVPWTGSVQQWLAAVSSPWSAAGAGAALHGVVVILPIIVMAAAAASARWLNRRDWLAIVFAVLATLTALPRWDRFHMAYAAPVHAVALAVLISTRMRGALAGRSLRAATAGLVLLAGAVATQPVFTLASGDTAPSALPHFRGPLITRGAASELEAAADRIAREARGQPAFILSLEAGFWHLSSGVGNPTPFDIPATTSLGASGVTWLAARLADGSIGQACVDRRRRDRLALTGLAAIIETTFAQGADVGPCTWYRARTPR